MSPVMHGSHGVSIYGNLYSQDGGFRIDRLESLLTEVRAPFVPLDPSMLILSDHTMGMKSINTMKPFDSDFLFIYISEGCRCSLDTLENLENGSKESDENLF